MVMDPPKRSTTPYFIYFNDIFSKLVIDRSAPFYCIYFLSF